jgi:hypothetical protein
MGQNTPVAIEASLVKPFERGAISVSGIGCAYDCNEALAVFAPCELIASFGAQPAVSGLDGRVFRDGSSHPWRECYRVTPDQFRRNSAATYGHQNCIANKVHDGSPSQEEIRCEF